MIAVVITFAAILPAEYNQDPLGLGRVTGLSRLWAPEEVVVPSDAPSGTLARREPAMPRKDSFEITLAPDGAEDRRNSLEFKVKMNKGSVLVYTWRADPLPVPEDLMFDFHGHTVADTSNDKVSVADYERGNGGEANGSLISPIDGIHGWYFRNRSNQNVTISLELAGYYELIPAGQEGNLAGVAPKGAEPAPR